MVKVCGHTKPTRGRRHRGGKKQQAAAAAVAVAEQAQFKPNTTISVNNDSLSLKAANNVVIESLNDGTNHYDVGDGFSDGEDGDDNENKCHDYANIAIISKSRNAKTSNNKLSLLDQKPAQHQLDKLQQQQQQHADRQKVATSLFSSQNNNYNHYHCNISKATAPLNNHKKTVKLKSALKKNYPDHNNNNNKLSYDSVCKHETITGKQNLIGYHQLKQQDRASADVKEQSFDFVTGINSRCNCSGRRRATLAGLIELFEQKIRVNEPTTTTTTIATNSASQQQKSQLIKTSRNKRATISKANVNDGNKKSKVILANATQLIKTRDFNNSTRLSKRKMRNIITPVKYDPTTTTTSSSSSSTSSSTTSTSTEEADEDDEEGGGEAIDSLECCNGPKQNNCNHNEYVHHNHNHNQPVEKLHHVALKGVPVLPNNKVINRKLAKKLTKTNWQPPTNGRQYELKLKPPICHYQGNQQRLSNHGDCDGNLEFYDHHDYDVSDNKKLKNNRTTSLYSQTTTGLRGPPIVKHQTSSSKRLLNQLARLRKLNEPNYRIKRPEKVAQVESLIEQLERATSEWEEDELLLDRAERRDWPEKYYKLYVENNKHEETSKLAADEKRKQHSSKEHFNNHQLASNSIEHSSEQEEQQEGLESLSLFGRRADVDPIETDTIARSHSIINLQMMGGAQYKSGSSTWTSSNSFNRGRQARAFADRYFDDQAVRRLRRASLSSNQINLPYNIEQTKQYQQQTTTTPQSYQMSYLLCSNAYTPIIDSNTDSPYNNLDSRIRNDDLYYRNVRTKPEQNEPPFGIPRQEAIASSHSVASHYLRRQNQKTNNNSAASTSVCLTCNCYCKQQNNFVPINARNEQEKRADSKVSFVRDTCTGSGSGRASADSGVVGGGSTPSSAGRQSAASRLTLNSPTQYNYTSRPVSAIASRSTQAPKQLCDSSSQTVDYNYAIDEDEDDNDDDDDAAREVDIEKELNNNCQSKQHAPSTFNKHSPFVGGRKQYELRQESRLSLPSTRCKSPMLEHYKAEIIPKPMRGRPVINIEHPRAKSPLLRVSAKPPVAVGKQNPVPKNETDGKLQTVKIQCYNDHNNLVRPATASRPVSELECRYDFDDEEEEDDDDGDNIVTTLEPARKIVTTNLDTIETSSEPNESSIERLNYRGEPAHYSNNVNATATKPDKNGPIFSIGEYKSINKPGLIFL